MKEFSGDVEERVQELEDQAESIQVSVSEFTNDIIIDSTGRRKSWGHENPSKMPNILQQYEEWYNSSLPLIQEYLPERKEDFQQEYQKVRQGIEIDIEFIRDRDINSIGTLSSMIMTGLLLQVNLLQSIPERVESEALRAKRSVSSNLVSEELQKAKQLFDDNDIRAAGVISGVALERHLLTLANTSNRDLDYSQMDGITSLAQTLSDAHEISDDDQRQLEYLSGIRNKCSHASDKGPDRREVERLIEQSSEFIQGSFD
jgi:hypothetical protein